MGPGSGWTETRPGTRAESDVAVVPAWGAGAFHVMQAPSKRRHGPVKCFPGPPLTGRKPSSTCCATDPAPSEPGGGIVIPPPSSSGGITRQGPMTPAVPSILRGSGPLEMVLNRRNSPAQDYVRASEADRPRRGVEGFGASGTEHRAGKPGGIAVAAGLRPRHQRDGHCAGGDTEQPGQHGDLGHC